jgi:hypothetical protein
MPWSGMVLNVHTDAGLRASGVLSMRCINCYNTIADDVEFCPSCNFPIYRAKPAPERQAEPATGSVEHPETQPSASEQPLQLAATAAGAGAGGAAAAAARPALTRPKPTAAPRGTRGRPDPKKKKPVLPRKPGLESRAEKYRKLAAGVFTTLAVAGILFYALKSSGFIRTEPDPKSALQAIANLRSLPSNQAGQTVDQAMTKMLESARASGTLVSSQGWFVRPVGGGSGKVRVTFSFEEKQGKRQADWLVDLSNNSVAPENDLAASVYKG